MRILFDGRVLEGTSSGVRDIAAGLLEGLRSLQSHRQVELVVASHIRTSDVADIYIPARGYIHIGLPLASLRFRADRILIPRQTVPLFSPVRTVPVFHDIGFIQRADLYPQATRIETTTRIAARLGRGLAVSSYTAKEMEREQLGRGPTALPIHAIHPVTWAPDRDDPYVLCIAAQEPHKNLVRLVEAWGKADTGGVRLVLCGRPGLDTANIRAQIERSKAQDSILMYAGLNDADYMMLLKKCIGYVQPSYYEGLCIPVMDMAAAGVPLVISCGSNLGAVFSGAPYGQLFAPDSVEEMSISLARLIRDESFREASSNFNSATVPMTDWEAVGAAALEGMR